MRTELEQKLAEEYPFMRRDPAALEQQPVLDLYGAFGCDFGDGWYELIQEMCAEITQVYAGRGIALDFVPTQIKEKYGALVVYFSASHEIYDTIQEIADRYEEKSEHVCEVCGEPGKLRSELEWWRTLCDTHYKEMRGD